MLISSLAPPDSTYYEYGKKHVVKRDRGDDGDEWVQLSVTRITETRGKEMYPMSGVKHVCTKERCQPLSETDLIQTGRLPASAQPLHSSVYVCRFHSVHICTVDTCNSFIGTHDGVCPISGVYHGHTEGEKAWVLPEKRTAHFKRNGVKGMSARDANERDTEQAGEAEAKRRRIQLAEYSRTNVFGALFKRTEAGVASPPPSVMIEEIPDDKGKGKEELAEDEAVLARGVDSVAPKRVRNVRTKKRQMLYEEAAAIVSQLLYSDERKKINEQKRAKLDIQKQRAKRAYYADREGVTIPILTEMLNKVAPYDMKLPHMRILDRDERRIKYYVTIVLQSWKIVKESPWGEQNPGFRFEAHTLSVMYKMRKGLEVVAFFFSF